MRSVQGEYYLKPSCQDRPFHGVCRVRPVKEGQITVTLIHKCSHIMYLPGSPLNTFLALLIFRWSVHNSLCPTRLRKRATQNTRTLADGVPMPRSYHVQGR
jgi:hypothetical protein